jgi:PAS domain S-box
MGARPRTARAQATRKPSPISGNGNGSAARSDPDTELFRNIVENANDLIYTHDLDGNLSWVNAAVVRLTGYSREELLGKNIFDLVSKDLVPTIRERQARWRSGEELAPFQSEIVTKSGTLRTIEVSSKKLEHRGRGLTMLGIGRDITDRIFTESALRESENRFRTFVEQSSDIISLLDEQGNVIYQSESSTRHLGYTPQELMGRCCFDFVHPEDSQLAMQGFRQGLEDPSKGDPIALRLRHKAGYWKSFEAVSSSYVIAGYKAGLVVSFRYIGDRQEAEKELRRSEERFRQLFRRNLAGVFVSRVGGGIVDCNDSFAQMFGYGSREELLRLAEFDCYFCPSDRERFIHLLTRLKTVSNVESRLKRRDGSELWVLENASLLDAETIEGTLVDITERKRTEQALVESESKFRVLADTATTAIYIHNGKRFLYTNQACAEISGYSNEELGHLDPWLLVHPSDRTFARERAEARIRGECRAERYELRVQTKNGEERWLDFCASVTIFEGQQALLCTAFDVTERKRAERLQQALYRISDCTNSVEDLQHLYRALHEIVGELTYARNLYIGLLDSSGDYLHFPYFIDESDPSPPEGRPLGKGLTEYVLRTGKPLLADFGKIRELEQSGDIEPIGPDCVDWLGAPLRSGNAVFGVIALQSYDPAIRHEERDKEILTYVSQHIAVAIGRKRQEEALRISEARHRSLVESAVYGMYRSSIDGRFLDVNPALVNMLGYASTEELMSVDMARDIYGDHEERGKIIENYLQDGKLETQEVRWKRQDGRLITVRLNGKPFRNERGDTLGFEMIAEDVTERRTLEEQLRQSQKMEAGGRLAGGIAHDFNNLLTVIKGYSELMLGELDGSHPLRSEVDEIKKAADRAASLTRQLLAFSRQQVLAPKVIDLNSVVHNMDKLLRRLLGEDVDLFTVLDGSLGRVKADPGQLEQVVMNLAVNARDAMPQGGKLTIETANIDLDARYARDHVSVKPGSYVMIAVSDSGTGMTEKIKSRIFEPFFTTKDVGKGTGLGLSTVYGIVKQSGGYVWVYSELGIGSTFKVYLPRVDAPAEIAPLNPPMLNYKGSETVLLVEDEDGVRALVRQVLHKNGYNVIETRHGGEALLACERHPGKIDLLLTDVVLEQMSGRELAERLLQIRPEMKVLYVSGYADDAIIHHGVLTPGAAFLQKPFTTEALARKLRCVLDGTLAASAHS